MSRRSKERKSSNKGSKGRVGTTTTNSGKGRVDQSNKRKRGGLGKAIVSGISDMVETRQDNKTTRAEARQQSYIARTEAKAAGGKWTPESTQARWEGITGTTEAVGNAVVGGMSAYYGGGYTDALGSMGDILSGAGDGGVVNNPENSGAAGKGQAPRAEGAEGGVMAWASENPLLAAGGAALVLYVLSKAASKRKAA